MPFNLDDPLLQMGLGIMGASGPGVPGTQAIGLGAQRGIDMLSRLQVQKGRAADRTMRAKVMEQQMAQARRAAEIQQEMRSRLEKAYASGDKEKIQKTLMETAALGGEYGAVASMMNANKPRQPSAQDQRIWLLKNDPATYEKLYGKSGPQGTQTERALETYLQLANKPNRTRDEEVELRGAEWILNQPAVRSTPEGGMMMVERTPPDPIPMHGAPPMSGAAPPMAGPAPGTAPPMPQPTQQGAFTTTPLKGPTLTRKDRADTRRLLNELESAKQLAMEVKAYSQLSPEKGDAVDANDIAGVRGMVNRFMEGPVANITGKDQESIPATDAHKKILRLQSLFREQYIGPGNPALAEWQRLNEMISGTDMMGSKEKMEKSADDILLESFKAKKRLEPLIREEGETWEEDGIQYKIQGGKLLWLDPNG